jgi:hypothetical protein
MVKWERHDNSNDDGRRGSALAARRGFTPLSERRSLDPACWSSMDSRQVGDRRSNRQAFLAKGVGRPDDGMRRFGYDCNSYKNSEIEESPSPIFRCTHLFSLILT